MKIMKADSRPTRAAPASYFTGAVWQNPILDEPERVRAVSVTFTPGARTAWHTHPLGQTLFVVSGVGRVQLAGGPVQIIRPGDTVWIAPDERHWHGAAPDCAMTHIAIQEQKNGESVVWQEHVSDADYLAAPEQ
ncbi:MAG: cupin domain-containing protein [Hyphomicrobiales bacterium]|nr:cupin domain-containing protein [Hyphomicrobiales bacterium]